MQEGEKILKYTNGTYLIAPYNLVITQLNIPDSGEKCTNQHYISVKTADVLAMKLQIAEDELSKVYVGQEANIQASVYEDTIYTGYVTNISSTATYSSNGSTFTATVEFQNDGKILVGMSGTCSIILEKAENAIVVPVEAVTTQNNQSYVTVVNEDGSTTKKSVETGISNNAYTEIKSGLFGTETVQVIQEESSNTSFGNAEGMMEQGKMLQDERERAEMKQMPQNQ